MNYTLANEDTSLEYNLVLKLKCKQILAVCGSGGRSLPLLAGSTERLVCTDLSHPQLLLAKLRLATFAKLTREQFLLFWGFSYQWL